MFSPAGIRALPPPRVPPPGTLDGVVGLLLARAAPFDPATTALLRAQHGWGEAPPQPISDVRTHHRFTATAALRRLTAATAAPPVLLAALRVLEDAAPGPVADAAAALLNERLTETPMHPGGVLALARCYRVPSPVRFDAATAQLTRIGAPRPDVQARVHAILAAVRGAGHADLGDFPDADRTLTRRVDHQLAADTTIRRRGSQLLHVEDTSSGLAIFTLRMLVCSPRPLTVDELHTGLERAWRFRRPRRVSRELMLDWLGVQTWLHVGPVTVAKAGPMTPAQQRLADGGGTATLVQQLQAGPATFQDLLGALQATGRGSDAAKMVVHTHPILVHAAHDTYRLLGDD